MPNYYYPNYYQQPQPMMQQPQVQQQAPQIQNGGFVSVRNESEARAYPVAPGNSITFKDETAPYVYTKTMGFSQLDRPIFEKFKLVKEDVVETQNLPQNDDSDKEAMSDTLSHLKAEIEDVRDEIDSIRDEINVIKKKIPAKSGTTAKKKEVDDDE